MGQIEAALGCGAAIVYALKMSRGFRDAVSAVRILGETEIFLATPAHPEAERRGIFKMIKTARPDGVLIRNVGPCHASALFAANAGRLPPTGKPARGSRFLARGLERLTISYDLNIKRFSSCWLRPIRSVEHDYSSAYPHVSHGHCVFAAFLSKGASFLDCGRPCEGIACICATAWE
jgi:putative protease